MGPRALVAKPLVTLLDMQLSGAQEFAKLSERRNQLRRSETWVLDRIAAVRSFDHDEKGFSREATEQQARLKSIGIFGRGPVGGTLSTLRTSARCRPADTYSLAIAAIVGNGFRATGIRQPRCSEARERARQAGGGTRLDSRTVDAKSIRDGSCSKRLTSP